MPKVLAAALEEIKGEADTGLLATSGKSNG
jgi:hypothetical protein